MKAATMKHRGPQVNCALQIFSMEDLGPGEGEETGKHTAVTVSMHSTKGSEVKYRESESAYSFHSCPKRS